jgi:hypothetical protein
MLHTYDATFEDGYRDECLRSTDEDAESVKEHINRDMFQKFTAHDPNFHGKIVSIAKVN